MTLEASFKNGISQYGTALAKQSHIDYNKIIGSYSERLIFNGIIDYVEVEGIGRWSNLGGWVDRNWVKRWNAKRNI